MKYEIFINIDIDILIINKINIIIAIINYTIKNTIYILNFTNNFIIILTYIYIYLYIYTYM